MELTLWTHLWKQIPQHRRGYARAMAWMVCGNVCLMMAPLWFGRLQVAFRQGVGNQGVFFGLGIALLLFVLFAGAFCKYQTSKVLIGITCLLEKKLKVTLYTKIRGESSAFYDAHSPGALIQLFTQDVGNYRDMLRFGLYACLNSITLVVPTFCLLFFFSFSLASIALLPLLIMPFVTWHLMQKIYSHAKAKHETLDRLSQFVHETLTGIRLIKAYGKEKGFARPFRQLTGDLARNSFALGWLNGLFFPSFGALNRFVSLALVCFFGYHASLEMSSERFLTFMWLQSYLFIPILSLSWSLPLMQKGRMSYERMAKIYHDTYEVDQGDQDPFTDSENVRLHCQELSFTYPQGRRKALQDVAVELQGPGLYGITGPVGSGKSTWLKLLAREYRLTQGQIAYNGVPIESLCAAALRDHLGHIVQDPFLLQSTLYHNIVLGTEVDSLDPFLEASALRDTVAHFPDREHTKVGHKGVTLSGGQKKRIAMARALVTQKRILLFDDIFSSVDVMTQETLFATLRHEAKSRLVLFVSHQTKWLKTADQILVFQKGTIVEQGRPDDLLETPEGFFAAMVKFQEALAHV